MIQSPVDTESIRTVVRVIGLAQPCTTSRSPRVAIDLYGARPIRRLESPGIMGTRECRGTLCMLTRPRSADASIGIVRLALSDVAKPDALRASYAQRRACRCPPGHSRRQRSSSHQLDTVCLGGVEPAKLYMKVSDPLTRIPASPNYRVQHIFHSRTSCDQPRLLSR